MKSIRFSYLQILTTATPILSWELNPSFRKIHSAMSATGIISNEDNSCNFSKGTLLVSNFHKIGLSTDNSSKVRVLLASQSPRRREILDMMGLAGRYIAMPSPLNEEELQIKLANEKVSPQEYACTLAEQKAHAMCFKMSKDGNEKVTTIIIGSDTIVDFDGKIIKSSLPTTRVKVEKPKTETDAYDMIRQLSGNWHQVHTGVAAYAFGVGSNDQEKILFSFTDTARVKFASLTDDDILAYIATKEPFDKAGSYGIQGVGGQFVERIEGDFFTVMGLPMHRLSKELSRAIQSLNE